MGYKTMDHEESIKRYGKQLPANAGHMSCCYMVEHVLKRRAKHEAGDVRRLCSLSLTDCLGQLSVSPGKNNGQRVRIDCCSRPTVHVWGKRANWVELSLQSKLSPSCIWRTICRTLDTSSYLTPDSNRLDNVYVHL